MKGFQEKNPEQSDSPTAGREIFKLFCSIAANEAWRIEASDVRSAFLQSEFLDRNIFVKPPKERTREGYIWKLKKPVYGLNDASRKWFHSTTETLLSLGMSQSMGDNCLFYYRRHGKLEGILIVHVDDYLSAGSDIFQQHIMNKLRDKYKFGTISNKEFVYTGIQIQQDDESNIYANQNEFIRDLNVNKYSSKDGEENLNKEENRLLKKSVGQLNWASTQTRPDLSYDAFSLSTNLNKAKIKHSKHAASHQQSEKE